MRDDLRRILEESWTELSRGADDRHHGFHVPTLCTTGLDGAPSPRTVVLRRALAASDELHCHTDTRSPKVGEIARDPRVAWHFYASDLKLQLRIAAIAAFHSEGPRADEGWSRSALSSRRCYLAPRAPGAECDGPSPNLPAALLDRRPTEEETVPARANFGVIVSRVKRIDWLFLGSTGHRRARFTQAEDGSWNGSWLEP